MQYTHNVHMNFTNVFSTGSLADQWVYSNPVTGVRGAMEWQEHPWVAGTYPQGWDVEWVLLMDLTPSPLYYPSWDLAKIWKPSLRHQRKFERSKARSSSLKPKCQDKMFCLPSNKLFNNSSSKKSHEFGGPDYVARCPDDEGVHWDAADAKER